MATVGIFLSSEEHPAPFLVDLARKAEAAGFREAWISDHFHPWTSSQGESPFVWSTIGGIAAVTNELRVTTGVTCPTVRIHPAIVAQAAATCATMLPGGRFALGVGTGEALNEHIFGDPWPNIERRLAMLDEAVEVMRMLWSGGLHSHHGEHYDVDRAQLYSLPDEEIPVIVSGFGPKAVEVAARIGDGYANTAPDAELLQQYRDGGGKGPAQAGMKVCYGQDEAACVKLAHEIWPNEGLSGELAQVLQTPAHYEAACEHVTDEIIAEAVPCGPDPEKHAAAIQEFFDAGYDEVYVQQIGKDQDAFLRFYADEILPRFR
jgi:G6PDH family F420-dependent oxidoreductase